MAQIMLAHPGAELYGSDRMALQTVHVLRELGHTVTLVTPSGGPLVDRALSEDVVSHQAAVPVLRKQAMNPVGIVKLAVGSVVGLVRACLVVRASGAELVYVNTLTQPVWMAAARLMRRRLLVHIRENESAQPRVVRWALTFGPRLAHTVVCNSVSTRDFFVGSQPGAASRTVVVYNGRDWNDYQRLHHTRATPPRVVVVGRLSPGKGQDVMLRALAHLVNADRDLELRLVGSVFPGYEWFEESLRSLAAQLGVAARVEFAGFSDDVASEFGKASVAVVPSRKEAFGTVALEALAVGTPIVASNVEGLAEIVSHGKSGLLVPVDDERALASAIAELLDNPSHARSYVDSGRADLATRFSLEVYTKSLAHAVCAALGQATARSVE